jgi:hypothetical protein
MKTRDLFAGCHVTIAPHDDVWLVSLIDNALHTVSMQTYQELPDALEAVHEWMLMLSDETEVSPAPEVAVDLLREAMARLAIGEDVRMPREVDEFVVRDELRAWFQRETGE